MTDMPQHEINESEFAEQTGKGSPARRWWLWLLAAALISIGGYALWSRNAGTAVNATRQGETAPAG
jgi:hypothetical protein